MAYFRCGSAGVNLKNLPDEIVFSAHSAAQLDGENNHRQGAMHSVSLSVPVKMLKLLGYKSATMECRQSSTMNSSVNFSGTTVSVAGIYTKTISLQDVNGETLDASASGANHRDQVNRSLSIKITKSIRI